jgi:hypothetical protein
MKLQTASSIGPHVFGNSAHVVVAATTAVGVGSTVFTATSRPTTWNYRLSANSTVHRPP